MRLTIGQCATLSCLMECLAAKPGNVSRSADFADLTLADLALSASVIGPEMDRAAEKPLGDTVLEAVRVTRAAVGTNTNLGTILLLAPLARVPRTVSLQSGIGRVLDEAGVADAGKVFEAIRLAEPGGMGQVAQADLRSQPKVTLGQAMALAADRDLVARQYTHGFEQIFAAAVPWLVQSVAEGWALDSAIVQLQIRLMCQYPDSLIARKCGLDVARQASARAAKVLDAGPPQSEPYQRALADLDFWLRADGHRRNPGTTADLVAAALFVALREDQLGWPLDFYPRPTDTT